MHNVKQIIERNAGLLTSLLIYREFSFEEANRFLPQAVSEIVTLLATEDKRLLTARFHALDTSLMQQIDIHSLAGAVAIDVDQARDGVSVLLPRLFDLIAHEGDMELPEGEVFLSAPAGHGTRPLRGG